MSDPGDETTRDGDVGELRMGDWQSVGKAVRREFPGAVRRAVPLRIAVEAHAYAALHLYANQSLESEVCGVLVGEMCLDDDGPFVHVQDVVPGTRARSGSAHVTYTQETWEQIHREMDACHPKKKIVGWYHTHPGFGVTFSDMDEFIHTNFFPGETQVAFVLDPLGGQMAVGMNRARKLVYVGHIWVGGRERACVMPAPGAEAPALSSPSGEMAVVNDRLARVLEALEQQSAAVRRYGGMALFGLLVLACTWIVLSVLRSMQRVDVHPPELRSYVSIPVRMGDKTVLLGVHVVDWEIPPELNAYLLEQAASQDGEQEETSPDEDGERPQGDGGDEKPPGGG